MSKYGMSKEVRGALMCAPENDLRNAIADCDTLITELAEALEAVDKSWTEYWPEGPDYENRGISIADDTKVIWKAIKAALEKARVKA